MPYTLYVPDYDENGRRIIDQRELRIRNEAITPERRQQTHLEMKARDEAAKTAREKASEEAKRAEEFRVNAQAAAHYGIPPNELKPASMGIAQMLEAEQAMNAEFEAKKQELGQKYQGPDAGKIARELDELHQKQDAQLAAQFASNPMAELAIAQRSQEFRAEASSWLQTEIQTRQQQYFDTVDKKCNDALSAQISAMQPEQITSALQARENEMRALGRSPEQIQAAKQKVLGSYFQNLATTNPSAFLEAMASPGLATKKPLLNKENGEAGPGTDEGAGNSIAASLKNPAGRAGPANSQNLPNPLAGLAKSLPEEQLGKFSCLAERAKTVLEKKEKLAKLNLQQQKILQSLTGLDPDDQRSEIEKITSGLDDPEMAETLKLRLNLQLDYEDRTRAARDWQTGETIINQDLEPLQKIRAIQESDISESAREALIREVMGEPMAETPENQQSALNALLKISSGAIQQERDLHALFQRQNLTRNQAAFLTEAMSGKGRINGVPVGMAIRALQISKPELAEKPGELFNLTEKLTRNWPEGTLATYKNVSEQVNAIHIPIDNSPIRPDKMKGFLSDPNNPKLLNDSNMEKPRKDFGIDWDEKETKLDPANPQLKDLERRYGIAKATDEIQNMPENGYSSLNKNMDAPAWRKLERDYTNDGNPVEYNKYAFSRVKNAQWEIKDSSEFFGVAPQAITACMLDEWSAIINRGILPDYAQDEAATKPIIQKGLNVIDSAIDNLDLKDKVGGRVLKDTAYRTAEQMEEFLEGTPDRYQLTTPDKSPRLWDLGSYNVNLNIGYKCFERYVLNSNEDNPMKQMTMKDLPPDADKEMMWESYKKNCFLDPKGQTYVVAAVLKEGEKMLMEFIEERRKVDPEEFPEGCYSPEEFNCLVVDTYKKGFPLMKKQYLERIEKGDKKPMQVGVGKGLVQNRHMIENVLKK